MLDLDYVNASMTDPSDSGLTPKGEAHDVAVVGMACRAAGGIRNPEQLWQAIEDQRVASGEIRASRLEPYRRRDGRSDRILSGITKRGYFLDDVESFDHQFFGISPKEAEQMDPQQRISLEVAWEALQDAEISPKSLSGSDTCVYWGVNSDDYGKLLLDDLPNIDAWMGIGTAYCGVPNRISFHLNVTGASEAIDAACASSLVAVHRGAGSILSGESKIAIVGGVNVICGPGLTRVLDIAGALAADGECRSFDDGAAGYGRGEGAGAVILKSLPQALRDGDHIHSILKGSAVGHNGKTNGIMAPNPQAQELVSKNALRIANTDPLTVDYVEAHATSTALGDPTEISALIEVYGKNRPSDSPCYIGSVKPNIGHLEAGAGIMGLIKAVLAIQKGTLPPQANLRQLNTRIDWEQCGLKVVQELTPWPETGKARRAGVCSYGYGGTVAHAVLEQYSQTRPIPTRKQNGFVESSRPRLMLLSSSHEARLTSLASSLRSWIVEQDPSQLDLDALCCTLATRRKHHDFHVSAVVENVEGAIKPLDDLCNGSKGQWAAQGRVRTTTDSDVVWLFSGHGAQWTDMGKDLLKNPVFRKAVDPLAVIVQEEFGSSPIEWLETGSLESSDRVQILTYLMQIGCSAVLNSLGLFPQAVIGHSVGEIAASVIGGALSPAEGALIVTRRAMLYQRVMGSGAMYLVNRPYEEVRNDLVGRCDVVAAIDSSPTACVIAGPKEVVASVASEYENQGVTVRTVKTDIAFHSPMLEPLADDLRCELTDDLSPTPPAVKLYSTSLEDARSQAVRDVDYWVNNMVQPVRLTPAISAAVEDGYRRFLEISSHPLISHSLLETLMDLNVDDYTVVPTLRRDQPAEKCLLHAVGQLHCSGVEIDWRAQYPGPWMQGIPHASWVHRPVWREVTSRRCTSDTHDPDTHCLLGQHTAVAGTDITVYSTTLDTDNKPFPGSHPVLDTEIVPAACLINTFLTAREGMSLQEVCLQVPVAIKGARKVQVVLQDDRVQLLSSLIDEEAHQAEERSWVTHTTAKYLPPLESKDESVSIPSIKNRLKTQLSSNFTIDYLAKVGVEAMGFPWAVLEHHGDGAEMLARVDADGNGLDSPGWDPCVSWAALLDAATSIASTIFFSKPQLRMPAHVQRVDIITTKGPPRLGWIHVERNDRGDDSCNVQILDEGGEVLTKLTSMRFSTLDGTPGSSGTSSALGLVHQVAWPPALPAEDPIAIDKVILICATRPLLAQYSKSVPSHIPCFELDAASHLPDLEPGQGTAVVYIPDQIESNEEVPAATERLTWHLLEIVKYIVNARSLARVFVVVMNAFSGTTPSALAHAPLFGLCRIIASEHPDQFGGLIDTESPEIPLTIMKYIQHADIIRISDGIPRTARLRPLPRNRCLQARSLTRPEGVYLIAGGFGAVGLATAGFLADQGARRLVLISRRGLPHHREWATTSPESGLQSVFTTIRSLEQRGVTVHTIALDLSLPGAGQHLRDELDHLNLPPVLGVVHAAGVLENELVVQTTQDNFQRVLAPKVAGSLALHEAFPCDGTLDFFVVFSSCGQLFGFPGQAAYGSANSFVDALAAQRRRQGDNAMAIQWTAWRGMGLGSDSDFVAAELESKGITDITRDEAFRAWLYLARHDIDHGVVLRSRVCDADDPLPSPLLRDIAIRRARPSGDEDGNMTNGTSMNGFHEKMSQTDPKAYFQEQISKCIADVLRLPLADIDPCVTLSDLGLDSVMNVSLRRQLGQSLKVTVPPTLVWSYPTVNHLVGWFMERSQST